MGVGTVVNGTLHPNKGYTLSQPYGQGNYTNENFPGSVQTQVTAINDLDQIVGTATVGTGSTAQMHGFLLSNSLHQAQWQTIDDPNGVGTTTINGLNDHADLVGFYVDNNGNTDGFLARKS